jgi:ATP-dependent protease ClpP protease subunit
MKALQIFLLLAVMFAIGAFATSTAISINKKKRIEIIVLDDAHMVMLRGPITQDSMRAVGIELMLKSKNLPADSKLYLVIKTPGGDIDAGATLIEIAKGLPQRVDTITIESYSMGFHLVQALGERLITRYGKMMEHVGFMGVNGGRPGEVVNSVQFYFNQFRKLNQTDATRMGLTLDKFMDLIREEYWTAGDEAVAQNAADRVVDIRCADELPVENCPLIPQVETIPFIVGH